MVVSGSIARYDERVLPQGEGFLDLRLDVRNGFLAPPAIEVKMRADDRGRTSTPPLNLTCICTGVIRFNGDTRDFVYRIGSGSLTSSVYANQVLAGFGEQRRPVVIGTISVTLATNYSALGEFRGSGGLGARLTGRAVAHAFGMSTVVALQGGGAVVLESSLDFGRHEGLLDGYASDEAGAATLAWTFGRSDLRELVRPLDRLLTAHTVVSEVRTGAGGFERLAYSY